MSSVNEVSLCECVICFFLCVFLWCLGVVVLVLLRLFLFVMGFLVGYGGMLFFSDIDYLWRC